MSLASFFHQRLFLLFFLSPVKCYKYHSLRRYQLFWRQEQTTVEKKTSLRADQLIKNANMCKLILPSWNSNEPCFFFHGKNIEQKTIYIHMYIYTQQNKSPDWHGIFTENPHLTLRTLYPLARSCTLVTSPQGHPPFLAGKCSNPSAASNHDSKMSQNEGPMEWIRNGTILDGFVGCWWMNQMLEKSMYRRCSGFCWDHVCRSLHSIQFDPTCFILTPSHLSVEKLCCRYPGKWWTQKRIAGNDSSQLNVNKCFFLLSLSLSLFSIYVCMNHLIYLICGV